MPVNNFDPNAQTQTISFLALGRKERFKYFFPDLFLNTNTGITEKY